MIKVGHTESNQILFCIGDINIDGLNIFVVFRIDLNGLHALHITR